MVQNIDFKNLQFRNLTSLVVVSGSDEGLEFVQYYQDHYKGYPLTRLEIQKQIGKKHYYNYTYGTELEFTNPLNDVLFGPTLIKYAQGKKQLMIFTNSVLLLESLYAEAYHKYDIVHLDFNTSGEIKRTNLREELNCSVLDSFINICHKIIKCKSNEASQSI